MSEAGVRPGETARPSLRRMLDTAVEFVGNLDLDPNPDLVVVGLGVTAFLVATQTEGLVRTVLLVVSVGALLWWILRTGAKRG